MKDDADRELAIFIEALTLPQRQRAEFLERKCGADKKLRRKLEALMRAQDRLGDFLEEPRTGGRSSENN